MRLATFITDNLERILAEWVSFARTSGPAGRAMDLTGLRDHAAEMLETIVQDLRTPQSTAEGIAKSKGLADETPTSPDTPAEVHGAGRAESGFTIEEMVSEYRALRASVLRMWAETKIEFAPTDFQDVMRFNEAIDQALTESITRYTDDLDRSKEMFVAVLGHDLRTPLSAVLMASRFMQDSGELAEPYLALSGRVVSSATRMHRMVDDLLDFTRGRLGSGIPLERRSADLGDVARDAVDEVLTAHPDASVQLQVAGDVRGSFDVGRTCQVLGNLLGNAVQHGKAGTGIRVHVDGTGDDVVLSVQNEGVVIPAPLLEGLFSPFKRLRSGGEMSRYAHNLGLGLYIVERIVTAHGGRIAATSSSAGGTTVTVHLPRGISDGNRRP